MKFVERVILIVMDSVGIGRAHDAREFGDDGANTLGNLANWANKNKVSHALPTLSRLGLGRLLPAFASADTYFGSSARLVEVSPGKDTTTGHWEMAGTPLTEPFSFYPNGFPANLLDEWHKRAGLPGSLGNTMASGTAIIEKFGEEHLATGKPILYTSTDSVFQIAAHEKHFGLERLYEIGRVARELTRDRRIGRVICRPFNGERGAYHRVSEHRKDFSLEPPSPNLLDLVAAHVPVVSVGKIDDIFCHRSIQHKNHTGDNNSTGKALIDFLLDPDLRRAFLFANFIDFDQEFGHRRDAAGYLQSLREFDAYVSKLLPLLRDSDLLLITADHGNDPTFRGIDHTRENVPLLAYSPNQNFVVAHLGEARGYFHIAKLVLQSLGLESEVAQLPALAAAESFAKVLWSAG